MHILAMCSVCKPFSLDWTYWTKWDAAVCGGTNPNNYNLQAVILADNESTATFCYLHLTFPDASSPSFYGFILIDEPGGSECAVNAPLTANDLPYAYSCMKTDEPCISGACLYTK